MKLHFISFADGIHPRFKSAASRLCEMIENSQLFSTIKIYTVYDLIEDTVFWNQHIDFFARSPRGFGYWLWKPYIISKALSQIPEGDILLYCDACTTFHVEGKERFLEYLDMLQKSPQKSFFIQMAPDLAMRNWTKTDTIHQLDAKDLLDSPMVMATIAMLANTPFNRNLYNFIYSISCDYHLLDDSPSLLENDPTFKEHRHDQSILSILIYKLAASSIVSIPGEWYFPNNEPERKKYPFQIHSNMY
jgi:hypothetical protein